MFEFRCACIKYVFVRWVISGARVDLWGDQKAKIKFNFDIVKSQVWIYEKVGQKNIETVFLDRNHTHTPEWIWWYRAKKTIELLLYIHIIYLRVGNRLLKYIMTFYENLLLTFICNPSKRHFFILSFLYTSGIRWWQWPRRKIKRKCKYMYTHIIFAKTFLFWLKEILFCTLKK